VNGEQVSQSINTDPFDRHGQPVWIIQCRIVDGGPRFSVLRTTDSRLFPEIVARLREFVQYGINALTGEPNYPTVN